VKVLLTGATGFLGSHLASRLLTEGHDVAAYRRPGSSLQRLDPLAGDVVWFDLETDDVALPFQRLGRIDAVIHAATCYGRRGETFAAMFEANTAFPVRVLDAAVRFETPLFLNTDTVLDPRLNPYALSKRHFAEWGRMIAESDGPRFANIRLEHIYGAGDDASKFTTHVVRQCLQNVPVIPLTAGEQQRDFLHVDDAVAAYLVLLARQSELPPGYADVGLGSGCPATIRSFVELVHGLCRSTSALDFGALPYRRHECMTSDADITLLRSLGWAPRLSLSEGLQQMIAGERINLSEGNNQ